MNKIHSKVWNKELGQLVVASEFASSDSAGVVQGAGAATGLRGSVLAAVVASLLAVAGFGPAAFAQEWTITDGTSPAVIGDAGTVTVQGDGNINVEQTGSDGDAVLAITLDPDLVVDSVTADVVTTGATAMTTDGVAVGANVMLGSAGLVITGGPSVTTAGINAGNAVITNVAAGANASDAVNFGQLEVVSDELGLAQGAISGHATAIAANTANIATNTADIATNTAEIDAVRATASAGWDISAQGGTAANVASGGSVDFSGDANIVVSQSGTDLAFSLADTIEVAGLSIGGMTLDGDGVDLNGNLLTGLANGDIAAGSSDAVTGDQLHNALFEGGTAFGVRYFRANSVALDAEALGAESIAIGPNTLAEGASSFAAGDGAAATATAEGSIALGQAASAGTEGGAVPDGAGSIAIGRNSQASGNSTVALGDGASIDSEYVGNATALGAGARVTGNSGTGGTAVGANARASAGHATALGADAVASGGASIAIGQANAAAGNAIAAGTGAYVGTSNSIALGTGAGAGTEGIAGGDRTDHIAIGTGAGRNVQGNQTTAVGYGAGQGVVGDGNLALGVEAGRGLVGNNNISIGVNANDGAGARAQAVAIGDGTAAGSDSVALGSGARAAGSETVALGKDSFAGANGVALGAHTEAQGSNIALGRNSAARESDVAGAGYLTGESAPGSAVSVGNSNPGEAFQRRITNLADGSQRYDAVNVGQLQGAQQAVANLVGGNVTVEPNGSFGGYVIELTDTENNTHQYATIAEAINAVSSGAISVLPGDAVIYNPNGTVTVAQGVVGTDAVNVEQLNEAVAESGVKYFSANTTIDANRDNDGATADNAMAIGPAAVASGTSSLAVGHAARVNAGAHNGVAIGHDVSARAENATVLGNRSHSYDAGGVAIGQQAVSRGENSIVMGTGAEADPKSGSTVDNAIVIGTVAEATADDGIAIGQSALASEERAVAQGYDAHAMAVDSQASGTRARSTGVNSQASGTDAHASGANAIATGTNSRGYATDGIAVGTGAISGFVTDIPGEVARNHGSIAIGDTSRADDLNALALGVEANARAESATAIGDSALATADAEDGLAVGSSARVTAQNASAFGQGAEATAMDALAVGSDASASGQNASAVGRGAEASAQNASAFGQGARALHQGSVALGSDAITAAAIGTASIAVDKNTYNFAGTTPVATVSVGDVGAERTITNVAAGRISATSTDAINGSQLHGTNLALEALADDLDTAGDSIADVLGGNAGYDPDTHQVTMSDVGGTGENTIDDAIEYAAQGWDISANEGSSANVAPGGTVDFSSTDGNVVIGRDGTDLTFDLAADIDLGPDGSVIIGDTIIDGDSIVTNNLTVEGETRLGDNFVVNNAGDVTYNGSEIATQDDGLGFAGNTGGTINKTLGDGSPLTISGSLGAGEASTGANLRVDSDGSQLNLVMARNLTDLDSVTINNGGPVIDGDGIDMGGNQITSLADGTADDHAVNLGQLRDVEDIANAGWNLSVDGEGAVAGNNVGPDGVVDFSNDDGNIGIDRDGTDLAFNLADDVEVASSLTVDGNTTIDGTGVGVGDDVHLGDTGLVIADGPSMTVDGIDAGGLVISNVAPGEVSATSMDAINGSQLFGVSDSMAVAIGGNTILNPDGTVSTSDIGNTGHDNIHDAIGAVNTAANAGWNLSGSGEGEVNIGPDGAVDFQGDANISVAQSGVDQDGVIDITLNPDLVVDSVTAGDSVLDTTGLAVDDGAGNVSTVGAGSIGIADAGGTTTIGGTRVVVGGTSPITIDGDAGTIGGLANQSIDYPGFADGSGRAATEEQLGEVSDVANLGWNISAQGEDGTNVAPGGSVDLNNSDDNIVITKADDSNDVTFDLADDVEIGNSIAVGDTYIDGTGVGVGDDVHLGDTGLVIEGGPSVTTGGIDAGGLVISNVAPGVDGTDAVNVNQLNALGNTPLTFAGDAGANVDRLLGETVNLVGGADEATLTDGNIGVVADGDDTLEIRLNKDIDLGADGSVAIGDAGLDNDGLAVVDADGNVTTVAATGTTVTDGNATTSVGAGVVTVTANPTTGPANTIVIDANTGTIGGLANQAIDYPEFADGSGRAATEEQLGIVNETANMGWDISAQGGNETNVGPGDSVDLSNTDGNIVIAKTADSNDVTFDLAENIDLGEDGSLTTGDTVVGNAGVTVEDEDGNVTTVAADGTTVTDTEGNATAVGAGTVAVTDGTGTTTIGGNAVSVGGDNPIVISGDTGTIGGLTNTTFDPDANYTGGVAATQEQLSQVNNDLVTAGLDFVGDDGTVVHRDLGEQLSITGGADLGALSEGNIGVTSNADGDGLVVELADNIELTEDGSLTIGDAELDGDGLAVVDADGNATTVAATGTTVTDGNATTSVEAGVVTVTANPTTGPANTIVIDANTGTIGGLANQTIDYPEFADGSGRAATEEQLGIVNETANAGWNLTDAEGNEVNIGPNGLVTFEGDENITVSQTGEDQDGVIEVTLNRDLDVDSVTAGNSVLDNDGLAVDDGAGNSTAVGAGTVTVTANPTTGPANTIVIDANTGTIGGLANHTIDYPGFADGSGRAATEEQLAQVDETANMGWNISAQGENATNVGPGGSVDLSNTDGNIVVAKADDSNDVTFDLADDLVIGSSITAGDTFIDTTGVAIGADVHLGNTGLVINGGPSVTLAGINAGNLVVTNVAPGEISATSTDAINGSQLHGMGDSIVNVIGGNAELNPDGTITTSDIGGTGHDNIDDAIRAANDAANAGWTATDADGNGANIGPNGTVAFTGDGNISVAQTGDDNSGEIEITLNRDLDVDSITAGDTVIDTDGVRVGDDVHLGDTGLVIEGGPSVTTDGIDAGGQVISNVADGVADTDAANVGQLNQVAGDVSDLGDRMDVVEGDVTDLQAGAAGPFQVSQEAPVVAPTPTGANSAAGGSGADASGDNATALGNQAVASGENSTAVGQGAQATHDNSVALGQGSATTVGAQSGYDAAYVGSSTSAGEVNVGNRTVSGVAPGVAGTDAVNVNQLNAGVNHAVATANEYTDQRFNQVQGDVWQLHGRVDELEKDINSGVATAMAMRQAPYVAGATTYFAGFGAYKDQGALGVSLRRTSDNGRWSLEGGFSANRDGAGGYIGVSGVLGSK